MSLTQSNKQAAKPHVNKTKKQKIQEDALAFANLLYDIFKEEEAHGNVTGELDNGEYKDA